MVVVVEVVVEVVEVVSVVAVVVVVVVVDVGTGEGGFQRTTLKLPGSSARLGL